MFINPNLSGQLARDRHQEALARAERLRPARRSDRADETSRPVAAPERRIRRWILDATASLRRAGQHAVPSLPAGLPRGAEQVHDA
jgi:hypothetical protein